MPELLANDPTGTLSNFLIVDNLAEVVDRIHGQNGIVANNLPSPSSINPKDVSASDSEQGHLP